MFIIFSVYYPKSICLSVSNHMAQIRQQILFNCTLHLMPRPVLHIDSMSFLYTWHMLHLHSITILRRVKIFEPVCVCFISPVSSCLCIYLYVCLCVLARASMCVCVFFHLYVFSFSLPFVSFFTQSFPWYYILAVLILLISFLYWLNAERLFHLSCVIP